MSLNKSMVRQSNSNKISLNLVMSASACSYMMMQCRVHPTVNSLHLPNIVQHCWPRSQDNYGVCLQDKAKEGLNIPLQLLLSCQVLIQRCTLFMIVISLKKETKLTLFHTQGWQKRNSRQSTTQVLTLLSMRASW